MDVLRRTNHIPIIYSSYAILCGKALGISPENVTIISPENVTIISPVSTTLIHDGPVLFDISDTIPQVVLTMIIVAFAIIVGICIGKLAEWCYDRHMANRDDISDISEHTRGLLKAKVALMKMKGGKNNRNADAENGVSQDTNNANKPTLLSVWGTAKKITPVPTPKPENNTDATEDKQESPEKLVEAESKNLGDDSRPRAPSIQVTSEDPTTQPELTTVEVFNETAQNDEKKNDDKKETSVPT